MAKAEVKFKSFELQIVTVRVNGISTLITNNFSATNVKKIRDKQTGKNTGGRKPKDIESQFRGSLYINPETGNYCLPTAAFKKACVSAARQDDSYTMTKLWGAFHVLGDWVDVEYEPGGFYAPGGREPRMREDRVNLRNIVDLRYRGEFWPWSLTLQLQFNPASISVEELGYLLGLAGFAVGVGDWRPETHGDHGMFQLDGSG